LRVPGLGANSKLLITSTACSVNIFAELRPMLVCLLRDANGHSNILKAGKAEELKTLGKGELPEKQTS